MKENRGEKGEGERKECMMMTYIWEGGSDDGQKSIDKSNDLSVSI